MDIVGHAARHAPALVGHGPALAPWVGSVRLILHILAATVWIGGQVTVAGLLPTVRTFGEEAPKRLAQALARLLWPAYAVLVITGFWNVGAAGIGQATSAWKTVLFVKIAVVLVAGAAVYLHQEATTVRGKAVWGAIGALFSVAALCLGVFLAG